MLRDQITGRGPDGTYNGTLDSFLAMRCMDWPRRIPAEQTEMLRRIREAAPFMEDGRPVEQNHYACEAWPKPPSRTGHWLTGDVTGLPSTLTVSTIGDVASRSNGSSSVETLCWPALLAASPLAEIAATGQWGSVQRKMAGVSDTGETMWRSSRERLDVIIGNVRAQVASEGLQLLVQVEPSEEPSPAAVWHWHLTCSADDAEIDVIASQDLATFMLEDDNGRFEIEADAAEFPGALTRRLLG